MNATYTVPSLRDLIRASDIKKHGVLSRTHLTTKYLTETVGRFESNEFRFAPLKVSTVKNFKVFKTRHLGDELLQRSAAKDLTETAMLQTCDRNSSLRQLMNLLAEGSQKSIVRMDISSFYESISREELILRLFQDFRISAGTIRVVKGLFRALDRQNLPGLPRGLALSAALSEYYLSEFDEKIRRKQRIYFYQRYVDDMIILTVAAGHAVLSEVRKTLPQGLRLNEQKTQSISVGCSCYFRCVHESNCPCKPKCKCAAKGNSARFDYLGYKFSLPRAILKNDRSQEITIHLAESKKRRIRKRIVAACHAFLRERNFLLFRQRLLFLTENHSLRGAKNYGRLYSGITYDYPLLTNTTDLKELDEFLRQTLTPFGGTAYGGTFRRLVSAREWRQLLNISFVSGYSSKRSRRMTPAMASNISACWSRV